MGGKGCLQTAFGLVKRKVAYIKCSYNAPCVLDLLINGSVACESRAKKQSWGNAEAGRCCLF